MPQKTPRPYARGTNVSTSQTYEQIKTAMKKYGATGFAQAEDGNSVLLMFVLHGTTPDERRIRFRMPLPTIDEFKNRPRTHATAEKRIDAETNRRWRALGLGIKAKLVLVEEGIESVEQAFWAHVVLPSGNTIYEETASTVARAYELGEGYGALLPALPAPKENL